jgi:predicted kinase
VGWQGERLQPTDVEKVPGAAPTLHLMVGLPATGKTTLARRIEQATAAVRLTPDDWMLPLFGTSEADGARDVLEGRLLWLAHRILLAGASVVVDFGCWSAAERYAVRSLGELAGARFALHELTLPEADRRARVARRSRDTPHETFPLHEFDHERHLSSYEPMTADERDGAPLPRPPAPHASWPAWPTARWPSLPLLATVHPGP